MSESEREARQYPRLEARQAVLVRKVAEGTAVEELAPTKTIAVGGCSLLTEQAFGKGSPVELLIAMGERVVTARGTVVYENRCEDGRTETGIQFARLDDEAAHAIHRLFIKTPEGTGR